MATTSTTTEFTPEQLSSNFPLGEELAKKFGEAYFRELGHRVYKATGVRAITFRSAAVANQIMKDLHDEWIVNPTIGTPEPISENSKPQ